MFGRKKKEMPRQEFPERSRDMEELETLWSELESEKQAMIEQQDAYRQSLEELNAEAEQQRKALEEEILLRKRLTEEHIQKNLTAFQENYSYYLSQLKLLMDVLTNVSLAVSKTIVTQEDVDAEELFRTMFSAQIDPNTFLQTPRDQTTGGLEEREDLPSSGEETL